MVRYNASVIVPYARERVWAVMSDWRNIKHWDMNITKCDLSPGQKEGQTGLHTTYDSAFKLGNGQIPVSFECAQFDAPHFCEYVGLATLFKSRDSIRCEAVDAASTRVSADFNLAFRGILSPLSFLLGGAMQNAGPTIMKDIEAFVAQSIDTDASPSA